MSNWKPEISTDGGKSFSQNAQVFATREEAETMARDIFNRWLLATDYRAVESNEPVTHQIKDCVLSEAPRQMELALTESEGGEA